MNRDPLDHLRRLDPARDEPPAPEDVEALLARVKADPAPRRGAVRFRRSAVTISAALTLVAVLVVLFASGREAEPSYAARANAAVALDEDGVVHARLRTTVRGANGQITRVRAEEWWLGAGSTGFARIVVPDVRARSPRRLVTVARDGRTTTWSNGRIVQRVSGQLTAERAGVFDPGAVFRRAYRDGRIRDRGPLTGGAGRKLRRFTAPDGNVVVTYDADAESWQPVRVTVAVRDFGEARPRSTEATSVEIYERTVGVPPATTLVRR